MMSTSFVSKRPLWHDGAAFLFYMCAASVPRAPKRAPRGPESPQERAKMAPEGRSWGDHVGGVMNRVGGVIKISRGEEITPPDVDARTSFTNTK